MHMLQQMRTIRRAALIFIAMTMITNCSDLNLINSSNLRVQSSSFQVPTTLTDTTPLDDGVKAAYQSVVSRVAAAATGFCGDQQRDAVINTLKNLRDDYRLETLIALHALDGQSGEGYLFTFDEDKFPPRDTDFNKNENYYNLEFWWQYLLDFKGLHKRCYKVDETLIFDAIKERFADAFNRDDQRKQKFLAEKVQLFTDQHGLVGLSVDATARGLIGDSVMATGELVENLALTHTHETIARVMDTAALQVLLDEKIAPSMSDVLQNVSRLLQLQATQQFISQRFESHALEIVTNDFISCRQFNGYAQFQDQEQEQEQSQEEKTQSQSQDQEQEQEQSQEEKTQWKSHDQEQEQEQSQEEKTQWKSQNQEQDQEQSQEESTQAQSQDQEQAREASYERARTETGLLACDMGDERVKDWTHVTYQLHLNGYAVGGQVTRFVIPIFSDQFGHDMQNMKARDWYNLQLSFIDQVANKYE